MFLCELLQAAHGGLLELHQTLTGTRILHLDLPLTLLCKEITSQTNSFTSSLCDTSYFHLNTLVFCYLQEKHMIGS